MKTFHAKYLSVAAFLFVAALSYGFLSDANGRLFVDEPKAPAASNATESKPAASAMPKDESGCFKCHSQLSGKAQVLEGTWAVDTHHGAGVSCVGCHGGNPDASITMANWKEAHQDIKDAKGKVITPFIARADAKGQLQWCGSCHESADKMKTYTLSKPEEKLVLNINAVYSASAHGKAALEEGNAASASCVGCHSAHGAMKATEITSLTYPKNIANMCGSCHSKESYMKASLDKKGKSYEDHTAAYMESVHANAMYVKNDLSVATCNDCHGNHGDHPEEVANVTQACNTCHASIAANYAEGPHAAAYAAYGNNGCISCHGSPNGHRVVNWGHEKVGVKEGAQCLNCHNANLPEPPAYKINVAEMMKNYNGIEASGFKLATAMDSLRYAVQKGFFTSIKYLAAPLKNLEDSLKLTERFFMIQQFAVKLESSADSAEALKLAPAVFKFVDSAKVASLQTMADSVQLIAEATDYANGWRRHYANLRAMGSATKLNAYLVDFEKTHHHAKEFFEAREKDGYVVQPELAYLEELKRQADATGGNHHVVRSAIFEEKMKEGFLVKDSVQALVKRTESDMQTRKWTVILAMVLAGLVVVGLVAKVNYIENGG